MKTLIIREDDFEKVVPWWRCFNIFSIYAMDAMAIGHYGTLEYCYEEVDDLPKLYQKLV